MESDYITKDHLIQESKFPFVTFEAYVLIQWEFLKNVLLVLFLSFYKNVNWKLHILRAYHVVTGQLSTAAFYTKYLNPHHY